jgi:hypothetical protein
MARNSTGEPKLGARRTEMTGFEAAGGKLIN